ncbi:MAG TPA: hypothetical protein VJB37_01695 [Patescibacteria group bacterium]|nr:hypothetical protein [Patescibacteria group bacterium]
MNHGFIRHLTAILATLVCVVCFYAGYKAGIMGWWWAGLVTVVMYPIIYKLLEV